MRRSAETSQTHAAYRCGAAARWLPRALAGSLLAAALVATRRVDPEFVVSGSQGFRTAVIVLAAILAVWILRQGSEVRLRIELHERDLVFESGRQRFTLPLGKVEALRYDAPFGLSRSWLPATILVDQAGREWRLPALLDGGERLVEAILQRGGNQNLEAWAGAFSIGSRMSRARRRVGLGYATAAAILGAGLLYYLH